MFVENNGIQPQHFMNAPAIHLLSDFLHFKGTTLENPGHITIPAGVTAVIGANGSGKSTLGNIIEKGWNFRTNRISSDFDRPKIRKIEFSDIHSLAGLSVEYYQQRYESSMNDEVPTVAELFADRIDTPRWRELTDTFNLAGIENRRINFLSSGELRKTLVINALYEPTDMLILDNPYIGLDAPSRKTLDEALANLPQKGVSVMLLVANPDDIPPSADCIIPMRAMTIGEPITAIGSLRDIRRKLYGLFDYAIDMEAIPAPPRPDNKPVDMILKMEKCRVSYGRTVVLDSVSWEIRDRQCWALAGPNGSGKSTLLSLICADNPKAYSNDITLFDRHRGSGETIWDIKRRIGYISPEMSLHFNAAGNVATIVAQGLNDTTGLFIRLRPGQYDLAMRWLRMLHLEHLAERQFNTLSTGERQLVLLARTFIKQPRLLILDEPFHGLDYARTRAIRALINYFAARSNARPESWPVTIIFVSHYISEMPECITFTKTLEKQSNA